MEMQYRLLGRTGVRVSPICLGTMMFGNMTDGRTSTEIIHKACDLGINFLDTADVYNQGESERIVGQAIADRREHVVLATKGRQKMGSGPNEIGASRLHMMLALERSLQRLGTDYVDIYYCHAPDYDTVIEETLRAMDDMVRQGKVRYTACSNFRAWRLCEALWTSDRCNLSRFACIQPLYNLVNRDIEVELLPLCREYNIGVVSYSPLARGILTGKYPPGSVPGEGTRAARKDPRMMQAEWREASLAIAGQVVEYSRQKGATSSQFALAWCLANSTVSSIIVGPRTMEQFDDNCGCLNVKITSEDEAFVDKLVPPGEHSGYGFQDPVYPITGRRRD
jgi:aryl-alcohol dehydrogenase-like predicted oxidoreductase